MAIELKRLLFPLYIIIPNDKVKVGDEMVECPELL